MPLKLGLGLMLTETRPRPNFGIWKMCEGAVEDDERSFSVLQNLWSLSGTRITRGSGRVALDFERILRNFIALVVSLSK